MALDQSLFSLIHSLAGTSKILDWIGIFLASGFTYIVIGVFVILVLRLYKDTRHRFYHFAFTAFAVLLSRGFFAELLYFLWSRSRPFAALRFTSLIAHPDSPAFPSGHAALLFAIAFSLFFFRNHHWSAKQFRTLACIFIFAALLNGVARVFVGVHWPLDIAGGALFAFISVLIVRRFMPFTLGEK